MAALPPAPPALSPQGVATAARRPAPKPPAYMLVHAREFSLNLSRRVVPVGRVVIQVVNIGEDPHDVAVRTRTRRQIAVTPIIRSGGRATLRLKLKAGRYTLWCRVPGHFAHGMSITFWVKKPAPTPTRRHV